MSEPALRPHRPDADAPIAAGPEIPPERPSPAPAEQNEPAQIPQLPARNYQLGGAQRVHGAVDALFRATCALEELPDEAWDAVFNDSDVTDTVKAAARLARDAYAKALTVEVLLARSMET